MDYIKIDVYVYDIQGSLASGPMEKPGPHLWSILEPFFWDQSSVETPRNLLMSPMTCASIVMASGALVSNARSPVRNGAIDRWVAF